MHPACLQQQRVWLCGTQIARSHGAGPFARSVPVRWMIASMPARDLVMVARHGAGAVVLMQERELEDLREQLAQEGRGLSEARDQLAGTAEALAAREAALAAQQADLERFRRDKESLIAEIEVGCWWSTGETG